MKPNSDTASFLETLLWAYPENDNGKNPFADSSIYDFHPEFITAVDSFISRFREYLATNHPDLDPDDGERSFGGNCYFSLSGHGCGFRDDSDYEWGDAMHAAIKEFSATLPGGRFPEYRFESIDLSKHRGGEIDLSILVKHLPKYRRELFGIPENVTV